MTAAPPPIPCDERLDLVDALVYGDVFDCAVTLDELWRFGRARIDRKELVRRLRGDPSLRAIVAERDGLYCLADRPGLLDRREQRLERARRLQQRGDRVARALRLVPFVRGLALTGSAAAGDAGEAADVDLLVIVAPARLGIVFFALGSASRLSGRRLFCPNYYIRADRLEIAPEGLYVARELSQARSLLGSGEALRTENPWLADVFPNAFAGDARDGERTGSRLQRLLELPLRGRLGDRLERSALRLAAARLRAHYAASGRRVPADVAASLDRGDALRFHAGHVVDTTMARYAARRTEIADWLDELDRRHAAAGPAATRAR